MARHSRRRTSSRRGAWIGNRGRYATSRLLSYVPSFFSSSESVYPALPAAGFLVEAFLAGAALAAASFFGASAFGASAFGFAALAGFASSALAAGAASALGSAFF